MAAREPIFKFTFLKSESSSELISGACQNLERRNVERFIFRNFKIANIKMTKYELFYSFIVEFIFFIFYKIFE